MTHQPLLEIEDLNVSYPTPNGPMNVVRGVSFSLGRERLGIVGESGSGKSTTGRAILGLVPSPGSVTSRRLVFDGQEMSTMNERGLRRLRGSRISMIMQDPKYSLNPVISIGRQVMEAYLLHRRVSKKEARDRALEMLEQVRIRDPEKVFHQYPHQVSGGMGQRVMIAAMLITEPDILVADEPISALDVTVQNEVLRILDNLVTSRGMGLIFISHNFSAVASLCDRVLVMYGGRVVEECDAKSLYSPSHPYTQALVASIPSLEIPVPRLKTMVRDPQWLL